MSEAVDGLADLFSLSERLQEEADALLEECVATVAGKPVIFDHRGRAIGHASEAEIEVDPCGTVTAAVGDRTGLLGRLDLDGGPSLEEEVADAIVELVEVAGHIRDDDRREDVLRVAETLEAALEPWGGRDE